jgi:hypothetical protein
MGFGDDQVDERLAPQCERHLPGLRLVDPHERGFDAQAAIEPKPERDLQRLHRVVAAVRVPGIVRLAHPAHQDLQPAPVRHGRGDREEQHIAARDEGVRQAGRRQLDIHLAREGSVADLAQHRQIDDAVLAEPRGPRREFGAQARKHARPRLELDAVALPVIEADGFDPLIARERPGEAGGGVLPAREENQCAAVHPNDFSRGGIIPPERSERDTRRFTPDCTRVIMS